MSAAPNHIFIHDEIDEEERDGEKERTDRAQQSAASTLGRRGEAVGWHWYVHGGWRRVCALRVASAGGGWGRGCGRDVRLVASSFGCTLRVASASDWACYSFTIPECLQVSGKSAAVW